VAQTPNDREATTVFYKTDATKEEIRKSRRADLKKVQPPLSPCTVSGSAHNSHASTGSGFTGNFLTLPIRILPAQPAAVNAPAGAVAATTGGEAVLLELRKDPAWKAARGVGVRIKSDINAFAVEAVSPGRSDGVSEL